MDNFSKILEQMQQGNKDDLANKKTLKMSASYGILVLFAILL